MKPSAICKKNFYGRIGELLEQAREEKGWSLEHAALHHKISIRKLIQYEYAAGSNPHNLPLGQLLNILVNYDRGLRMSLIRLSPEDYDAYDTEEKQKELIISEMSEQDRAYLTARLMKA